MGLVLGSLISIKLHVPRVPRNVVARPRLLEELAWDGERRLTLLSAPAGFGKAILPGEWAVFQGREEKIPGAPAIPNFVLGRTEMPSPTNPMGVKDIGES